MRRMRSASEKSRFLILSTRGKVSTVLLCQYGFSDRIPAQHMSGLMTTPAPGRAMSQLCIFVSAVFIKLSSTNCSNITIILSPQASQSTIISIFTTKPSSRVPGPRNRYLAGIFVAYSCNWGGNYTPSTMRQCECVPPGPECGEEMQRY